MAANIQVASPVILSKEAKQKIDQELLKFPNDQKQSAVMAALTIVQKENGGWLTTALMDAVANYLDMSKIAVYEVATFYSMYELKPVGKVKIAICTNVSCYLCGSDKIVEYLKQKLGIGFGQVTSDGKFSLKEVECLGSCGTAPMFQIDDNYYENLTPEKIDKILEQF